MYYGILNNSKEIILFENTDAARSNNMVTLQEPEYRLMVTAAILISGNLKVSADFYKPNLEKLKEDVKS